MSIPNDLCLFWYPHSPYAKKISWYLTLRGIAHAECMQPIMLPRPDLDVLNLNYRRIPFLTYGRDVFLDTRLIVRVLESHFPDGAIGAGDSGEPEFKAIQKLLVRWTNDAGVFVRGAQLIPQNMPAVQDPKYRKDRAEFTGQPYNLEMLKLVKPEAMAHMRDCFELLETTLLADGRNWVFKTEKPSLGDIEAIWPFHWVANMPGALAQTYISANQFPKTFAWIQRFSKALEQAKAQAPRPPRVKMADVIKNMAESRFYEPVGEVDAHDPTALKAGDEVRVWPTDTGSSHRDSGKLLSLTPHSIVISKRTKMDDIEIHVHAPRWGFRVAKSKQESANM